MKLIAEFEGQPVGELLYATESNQYQFHYDENWKRSSHFNVSPHITDSKAESLTISRYLENLLPEGKGLRDLSQLLKVSRSNTFALMTAIGGEVSGGIQFFLDSKKTKNSFEPISEKELIKKITERKEKPVAIWKGKPRLSVAGVQEKLPVTVKNGKYGFGEGNIASTHLLKFGNSQARHLVLNEFFCMKLAKACGLDVAEVELVDLGERVLKVERFDRKWNGDFTKVQRFHTIDGCQALDISPDHKYERFLGVEDSVKDMLGPASLKNIYEFCGQCRVPATDKMKLLQWVLFNWLIGNSDNHMKNLSFHVSDQGLWIAPFYDLVSVTVYDGMDHSMAFSIGECFDPDQVTDADFLLMCSELGIPEALLKRQLKSLRKKISDQLKGVWSALPKLEPDENSFLQQLESRILQRL